MRALTVVGNRPQFVKAAPLSVALAAAGIDEVVVHTGQHWDRALSRIFFEELGLAEPKHLLDLRTANVDALAAGVELVVRSEDPDAIVVLGDTNTTLSGARAGQATGKPVAHVEAGLRSGDIEMPEERNRVEVDRIAELLLAPDERAAATLRAEEVRGETVVVGDVMADATRLFLPVARAHSDIAARLGLTAGAYVVATVHREANVRPHRLRRIMAGLNAVERPVVFPAHPRTAGTLAGESIEVGAHVTLLEPLGYLDFVALASQAAVIATDSGGLQKEAYWYGVPCVTMRPSTEWVDTVALGANVLVDDDPDTIASAIAAAQMPDPRPVLYGDGFAAGRVATALAGTIARRAH